MDWWTVFYWGWWISWAPFVGIFLARISKGRTIKNVVAYTMTVPFAYSLVWFCTLGGSGIRMVRRAAELIAVNVANGLAANATLLEEPLASHGSRCYLVPDSAEDPGISPVCEWTGNYPRAFFDVLDQFGNIGGILNVLAIVAMSIYFITSSDSASLVIDALASNGSTTQSPAQRVIWAIAQGALTTALLLEGKGTGLLNAFKPILVILGLPYQVIVCLCGAAALKALYRDKEYRQAGGIAAYLDSMDKPENGHFKTPAHGGIFDMFEYIVSLGRPSASRGYAPVNAGTFIKFFAAMLFPMSAAQKISTGIAEDGTTRMLSTVGITFTHFAFVVSLVLHWSIGDVKNNYIGVLAMIFYCCLAGLTARLRVAFREAYKIKDGNQAEDLFCALFMWPIAFTQMLDHAENVAKPIDTDKTE